MPVELLDQLTVRGRGGAAYAIGERVRWSDMCPSRCWDWPISNRPVPSNGPSAFGNELEYTVEQVADAEDHLVQLNQAHPGRRSAAVDGVLADPPCGSLDAFLTIGCGIGEDEEMNVLHAFGHHELCDTGC